MIVIHQLWCCGVLSEFLAEKVLLEEVLFRLDQTYSTSLWLTSTRISDHWIGEDCKLASPLILQTLPFLAVSSVDTWIWFIGRKITESR
jgi:hypothetical protein